MTPAARAKQLYSSRGPLLRESSMREDLHIIFPLCSDHLITLLQYNTLRALAVNRTLVTGIPTTPLDCAQETTHIVSYPTRSEIMPPELLPTVLQQTVPHGDWIDFFPSPEGRDRLIQAAGTFDEDDLWADLVGGLYEGYPDDEMERRGMIAWSPPWKMSGWEMSEGFMKKWFWIFEDSPGALESTNRWRMQRCEEPLVCEDRTSREEL